MGLSGINTVDGRPHAHGAAALAPDWCSRFDEATLCTASFQCEPTLLQPIYVGNPKHKNRPARGPKGTLCPEWTHRTPHAGLGDDVLAHPWDQTEASRLFNAAPV